MTSALDRQRIQLVQGGSSHRRDPQMVKELIISDYDGGVVIDGKSVSPSTLPTSLSEHHGKE